MTEATPNTTTTPAPQAAPPAPTVDVEAIKKEAFEAAKSALGDVNKLVAEEAGKRVKETLKKALGEDDESPEIDPVFMELYKDPVKTLATVKDLAVDEAEKRIATKQAENDQYKQQAKELTDPFINEYPELRENLDIVDGLVRSKIARGVEFKEAVKASFEETVKRLGLLNAKDAAHKKRIQAAGLPPMGGGYSGGAGRQEYSEYESALNYIKEMRNASKAVREAKRDK